MGFSFVVFLYKKSQSVIFVKMIKDKINEYTYNSR